MRKRICYILILTILTATMPFQKYKANAAENIIEDKEVQSGETLEEENAAEKVGIIEETEDAEETEEIEETKETGKPFSEEDIEDTENSGDIDDISKKSGMVKSIINTEEDTTAPLIKREHTVNAAAQNDGASIFNNGEFSFIISDNSDLNRLRINIKGLPNGIKAEETINISEENENLQYTIKLPDAIYDNNAVIEVTDVSGNKAEQKLFTAEKNIIDTKEPVIRIEAVKGENKEPYKGEATNQQLNITVKIEALSGVRKLEMAFVPEGENQEDLSWEAVAPEDNSYAIKVGADIKSVKSFDKNAEIKSFETAKANKKPEQRSGKLLQEELVIKKGTYYFRTASYAGFESENKININLQQRSIKIGNTYIDKEPDSSGWYNIKTGAPNIWVNLPQNFDLAEEDEGYKLNIHMLIFSGEDEEAEQTVHNAQKSINIDRQFSEAENGETRLKAIENFSVSEDGCYTVYVWGNDEAGNFSETQKYIIKADYTAPQNVVIEVDGSDMTSNINDTSVNYKAYFKDAVTAVVNGEDALSGVDSGKTKIGIRQTGGAGNDIEGENSITVSENKRCYIEAELFDYAGNSTKVRSEGFVVDNKAPSGSDSSKLTINPKGANENGFFNNDFEIEVFIQDQPDNNNNAALKSVSYILSNNRDKTQNADIFTFDALNADDSQLNEAGVVEEKLAVKAADYESNDAFIEITATDNSGNITTTKELLPIDVTEPVVEISFDNNNAVNDIYYNAARTAYVTINEKNFDSGSVYFEITKDGNDAADLIPSSDEWRSEGDMHTVYIPFFEDGAYTIKIKCRDLADNEGAYESTEPFIIDTTLPQALISYNNEPWREGYYNGGVTAELTIVEHNFNEADFVFISQPIKAIGAWRHNGDTHSTTVVFDADGEYIYNIDYVDLAGNRMMPLEQQHLIVDTQLPQIVISGLEDNSANVGDITPVVSITDKNLDIYSITITMTDGRGQKIELHSSVSQLEQGLSYQLLNASQQPDSVYHLDVIAADMSGNQSTLSYRFSLNRNGSSYDISSAKPIVEQKYNKYDSICDIKIIETNVDEVEQFGIYMNRNGEVINGVQTKARPSRFNKNKLYYSVNRQGDAEHGYIYEYTLFRENFQEEGSYKLTFNSVDRAGNRVNNTFEDKDAQLEFIVDDTAPTVYIDGVKANELYTVEALSVNVYVTDNFGLMEAEFYLENDDKERLEVWNYTELASGSGDGITLTIPASEQRQSLLFYAADYAGNEIAALSDNDNVPLSFMITTNALAKIPEIGKAIIQPHVPLSTATVIVLVLAAAAAVLILTVRKIKKLKEQEEFS